MSKLFPLPKKTFATEGYAPNVEIARKTLEPLGIEVREVHSDENLPFQDDQFDLVMNRHESYSVAEVFRVLKPGGLFVTQQVGGQDQAGLNRSLGADEDFGFAYWHVNFAVEQLQKAGFQVIKAKEQFQKTRFYDVGAIVYYLKAIPWQIPDFNVTHYFDHLLKLHNVIDKEGFFETESHRFFIKAAKPE